MLKQSLKKEFEIEGFEVEMDRGYGVEAVSDALYLVFDDHGELESATLYGMHFIKEEEFEMDYDISTAQALELIK